MTRYIEAFSWTESIQYFLENVRERPLLNVCAGRTRWGDVTMDRYEPANVKGSWTSLPFATDSFGAVFADPPWNGGYKADVARFMNEALRVAPVAYLMAPWIYGGARFPLTNCWVRQMPGVNNAIVLGRYERRNHETSIGLQFETSTLSGGKRNAQCNETKHDNSIPEIQWSALLDDALYSGRSELHSA